MGIGPGIGKSLSIQDIEDAAKKAISNFGQPNFIFLPAAMMTSFGFDAHPEYSGTPWSSMGRMSKREMAVAGLHTTLNKLKVLKKLSEEDFREVQQKSIKRLKRAKWARYQQQKKSK